VDFVFFLKDCKLQNCLVQLLHALLLRALAYAALPSLAAQFFWYKFELTVSRDDLYFEVVILQLYSGALFFVCF
jgi:hypothetical protein